MIFLTRPEEMETQSKFPTSNTPVTRIEGGLRELLTSLPIYEIQKLFELCNRDGQPLSVMTTTIINSHGKDPKKILEDGMSECYLIYYLSQKGLNIDTFITKNNLIQEVLKFWEEGKHEKKGALFVQIETNEGLGTEAGDTLDLSGFIFAREFTELFYPRFNSLPTNSNLTVEDFVEYCHFRVKHIHEQIEGNLGSDRSTGETITSFINRQSVFTEMKRLAAICYFQPSKLKLHYRSFTNSQGVVTVLVSGTVHQRSPGALKGVFEQLFGLEKNHLSSKAENYKIKYSLLIVRDGKDHAKNLIQYMEKAERRNKI